MNVENLLTKQMQPAHSRLLADARSESVKQAPALQEQSKLRNSNADFYIPEESPWLLKMRTGVPQSSYIALPEEVITDLKNHYLQDLGDRADRALIGLFDDYHRFKTQLSYTDPELSRKYFGFTLGIDQQVQITDPDGVLTPAEVAFLTEQLNNRVHFKENLCTHARLLMTQIDHDRAKFPDQYKISLESFSKIIDYGQLFTRNTIGSFLKAFHYQLWCNAEKIEEKKPDTLIDVRA